MPNYSNLEQEIEQILFNYGGVLQKLAEIQKEVYEQIEALKNAGVKIRRANKTYSPGTVLACIGSGNGSKFLFTQNGGTTGEDFKDESWYNSLVVGQTYIDGGITWEVLEDAYTKHSIVESALNANSASSAGYASSAGAADAAYAGPFKVVDLGDTTSSSIIDGQEIVYSGINYSVIDPTRDWAVPKAGVIVNGTNTIEVDSGNGFLANGDTLYLYGSSGNTGSSFRFVTTYSELNENEFLTALAHNEGGKVHQIQYGDIVTPWPGENQGQITEQYNGPFKVELNGVVGENNTIPIKITDPTSPLENNKRKWAGKIFAGEQYYTVDIVSGNLNDGDYIYLMGDSKNGSVDFHYVAYIPQTTDDGEPAGGQRTITSAGFYVRLAKNEGGKIIQIQHGDITVPPWKVEFANSADTAITATTASIANYASSAGYYGPFHVNIVGTQIIQPEEGSQDSPTTNFTIKVDDDTRGVNDAGAVIYGSTICIVPWNEQTNITLQEGEKLYLVGTSDVDEGIGFTYDVLDGSTSPAPLDGQFYTQLAYNSGGKLIQTQFGDIIEPWPTQMPEVVISTYNGPFFVNADTTPTEQGAVHVVVCDLTDPRGTGQGIAGKVFDGATLWEVASSSFTLQNGGYVYLNGTRNTTPIIDTNYGTNNASTFSIRIAKNVNGIIQQIQYGDVYSIPWSSFHAKNADTAITATTASIANYASSAGYYGPFKANITGTTEGTNALTVEIVDPNDTATPKRAGRVFNGSSINYVASSSVQVADGGFVYLNGTSGTSPEISNIAGNNNTSEFSIRLAKNIGGKIVQMQHGDVYSIPWNAKYAESAGIALQTEYAEKAGYVEYQGPFHVSGTYDDIQHAFTGVSVKDDTRTGNIGGYMVLGNIMSSVQSATGITLSNGYKLYLKASKTASGYSFDYISGNAQPTPGADEFITQLAYNNGGKLIQTQFGDIIQPSTGVTKISVTGGTINPPEGVGDVQIIIPQPGSGDEDIRTYIYEQPHEADATTVSDAIIEVEPNTHILFAISHNLKEALVDGTHDWICRYYATGGEPPTSGAYDPRTRHVTDYNDPVGAARVGYDGYGAEFHLTEPSKNCTVIISNFDRSPCILSADNPIINIYGETFSYPDFYRLFEDTSYILTFVTGTTTSFWYMDEY